MQTTDRPAPGETPGGPEQQWRNLGPTQRSMARRMAESANVPLAAIWKDVNVEATLHAVADLKSSGVPATLTTFVVQAVARALREYPLLLAEFNFEEFTSRSRESVDVGVAVAAPRGLYVPVLSNADTLSLEEIAHKLSDLVQDARNGSLKPEQLRGGSFTITNIGGMGIDGGFPIPAYPQSAILGVASVRDHPVVRDGLVRVGKQTCLTLVIDHRAIDGITAAGFLAHVAAALDPSAG